MELGDVMNNKELEIEMMISSIKQKLYDIVYDNDLGLFCGIDWDEESELGLWNYDFAVDGYKEDIDNLAEELEIDYVTTFVSENYDECDYTICCYIDVRELFNI